MMIDGWKCLDHDHGDDYHPHHPGHPDDNPCHKQRTHMSQMTMKNFQWKWKFVRHSHEPSLVRWCSKWRDDSRVQDTWCCNWIPDISVWESLLFFIIFCLFDTFDSFEIFVIFRLTFCLFGTDTPHRPWHWTWKDPMIELWSHLLDKSFYRLLLFFSKLNTKLH